MHALILLLMSFTLLHENGGGLTNSNTWQYTLAETSYHTAGYFGEVIIDPPPTTRQTINKKLTP